MLSTSFNCSLFARKTTRSSFSKIKFDLSQIVKNQLRKVPALSFYLDDSLDHIDEIDDSIKNPFNPIKK